MMTRGCVALEGVWSSLDGHRVTLARVHFQNDYVGFIHVSDEVAFHTATGHPVWKLTQAEGRVTLTGVANHSVKILGPNGEELAHETVTAWPLEPWPPE